MERLTFEGNFCDIAMCTATRYGSFCEDGACSQRKVWERLKHYEDLQEQGRLILLPCKVGDTLYRIQHEYKSGNPFIRAVTFNHNNFWRIVYGGEFGKTVFLTREEAETALKGGSKE